MFEFAEEALDQVSLSIDFLIDAALDSAISLGRDVGAPAFAFDERNEMLPVIGPIGDKITDGGQAFDQAWRRCLVGSVALGQQQPDRQAMHIDDGVELGGQSSTRTANGVIFAPFFPPAACWWARMTELSMNCID